MGAREKDFELHAATESERAAWMAVIQHVSEVANLRDAYFKANNIDVTHGENLSSTKIVDDVDFPEEDRSLRSSNENDSKTKGGLFSRKKNKSAGLAKVLENDTETNVSSAREAMTAFSTALPEDLVSASANGGGGKGAGGASGSPEKAFALKNERATTYALRLDVDLEAMPPGSHQRREFTAHFQEDIARVCKLRLGTASGTGHEVHVTQLRHAPSLDWMTIVEFSFNLKPAEDQGSGGSEVDCAALLKASHADTRSILYQGMVTANVDASFALAISGGGVGGGGGGGGGGVGGGGGGDGSNLLSYLNSPDQAVQRIFNRYKSAPAPEKAIEISCFSIVLVWEEMKSMKEMWVLNPRLAGNRNACLVYPHDVKRALGISGTVHERFITPQRLVPLDLMPGMSAPLPFLPSPRSGGLPCIDATLLKSGLKYRVDFDDSRQSAIAHLSDEERQQINEAFLEFDANGDGSISRAEAMAYAQRRTVAGRAAIEEQFRNYITGEDRPTAEEVAKAETSKEAQLSALEDAEQQLMTMLEKADIDGDGDLSKDEFFLAEAWWMSSTLNPEKVLLF